MESFVSRHPLTECYQFSFSNQIAIKHGNGRDWWLIVGKWGGSSGATVFLIDETGVHNTGVQDFGPIPALWEGGLIGTSQDGNQIVRGQYPDGARFFDFNRCTGELGNMRFIPRRICFSAAHFSPDSKSVYVQTHRVMNTLDLSAIDTTMLADTLIHHNWYADGSPPFYTTLGFGEIGPDGKMYFTQGTSTTTLHVINRPNLPGLASDIELYGVNLTRSSSWQWAGLVDSDTRLWRARIPFAFGHTGGH